jgi:hypothetical protein
MLEEDVLKKNGLDKFIQMKIDKILSAIQLKFLPSLLFK